VKLGDRIALFGEHAQLAQYDTPAVILGEPADEFVASFIGSGAALRGLRLERVGSLPLEPVEVVRSGAPATQDPPGPAARAVLVDDAGKALRWLHHPTAPHGFAVVRADESPYDALDAMVRARDDVAAVVDDHGHPVGTLSWSAVVRHAPAGARPEEPVSQPSG